MAELVPPAVLFGPDLQKYRIFYSEMRDFLNRNGCNLTQHPSRKIINTLAHELYEEADERAAAIELAKIIIAQGKNPITPAVIPDKPPDQPNEKPSQNYEGKDKLAHNVTMRFKDTE